MDCIIVVVSGVMWDLSYHFGLFCVDNLPVNLMQSHHWYSRDEDGARHTGIGGATTNHGQTHALRWEFVMTLMQFPTLVVQASERHPAHIGPPSNGATATDKHSVCVDNVACS